MAELQLFDKLLQFPLFQGMSSDDLSLVVAHTKLGFSKHQAGSCLVKAGAPCQALYLLIKGRLRIDTVSDDGTYRVAEQMQAPYTLQPEALFGLTQRFTHTFTTLSDASLLSISKPEVRRLTDEFLVFRLNMLGLYATQSQKLLHDPWRREPASLRERVVRFFVAHCVYPAGPKTFHILMNRLAADVNDSRLNVSRVLNQLQADGLLTLHRGRIEIPLLEALFM